MPTTHLVDNVELETAIASVVVNPSSQPQNGAKVVTDYYDPADGTNLTRARAAAIAAAGQGGAVCYPPRAGGYGYLAPTQPLERQYHYGFQTRFYDSDDTEAMTNAQYALPGFTGSALMHWSNPGAARGAVFDKMGWVGLGDTTGTLNAFDFGPANSGGERSVEVNNCQMMGFGGAAFAGHMWVVNGFNNHISRCGYGIRPISGAYGSSCQMLDCQFEKGFIYFTRSHCVDLSGSAQHGQIMFTTMRMERAGTQVSGNVIDPNSNRDPNAVAIYATRLSVMGLTNISTDANAGGDFKFVGAVDEGSVNNVTGTALQLKRSGTGNNVDTELPAVWLDRCKRVNLSGLITFGDPNDGGTGRSAPQHGVWMNRAYYSTWDGTAELASGTSVQATVYDKMPALATVWGTQENNFRSYVRDPNFNGWQPIAMGTA